MKVMQDSHISLLHPLYSFNLDTGPITPCEARFARLPCTGLPLVVLISRSEGYEGVVSLKRNEKTVDRFTGSNQFYEQLGPLFSQKNSRITPV